MIGKKHKFVCLWEDCHDAWEQLCHHLHEQVACKKTAASAVEPICKGCFGYWATSQIMYTGVVPSTLASSLVNRKIDNVSLLSQTVDFPLNLGTCFSPATPSLPNSLSYPFLSFSAGFFEGFPSNRGPWLWLWLLALPPKLVVWEFSSG